MDLGPEVADRAAHSGPSCGPRQTETRQPQTLLDARADPHLDVLRNVHHRRCRRVDRAECVMLDKGPYIAEAISTLDSIRTRMQSHQDKKRNMLRQLWLGTRRRHSDGCPAKTTSVSGVTQLRLTDSTGGTPFEDGIDRGRVLIAGAATNNAYSLMELTVAPRPPDTGFEPHQRNDIDEVFVIRQGTIEFLLDHQTTALRIGDVVRVPRGPGTDTGAHPTNQSRCSSGSPPAASSGSSSRTEAISHQSTAKAS